MKNLIALLLTLSTTVALAQPHPQQKARGAELKQGSHSTGPIAGGGGFSNTNGAPLLEQAQANLVYQLTNASWRVFANSDSDRENAVVIQQKLIQLVSTLRQSPEKPRKYRKNQRNQNILLEFDYGTDADGDYIEALEPFFIASSMVVMPTEKTSAEENLFRLIQRKILHEAGHHLGHPQDSEASAFAKRIIDRLDQHLLLCEFYSGPAFPITDPYYYGYNPPMNIYSRNNYRHYGINPLKGIVGYIPVTNKMMRKDFTEIEISDLGDAKDVLYLNELNQKTFVLNNPQSQRQQIDLIKETSDGEFDARFTYSTHNTYTLANTGFAYQSGRCRLILK